MSNEEDAQISRTTQNWINFLQHDIGDRTFGNQTNAIIAIAFGGATSYLGASILTTFKSLSFSVSVMLVIFFAYAVYKIIEVEIKKRGATAKFNRYLVGYAKIIILIFLVPFFYSLIIDLFYIPVFVTNYFLIVMFAASFLFLTNFILEWYYQFTVVYALRELLIKTISEKISVEQISKWYNEISNYAITDCFKIELKLKTLPWESSSD
jgi:hypothetical protein